MVWRGWMAVGGVLGLLWGCGMAQAAGPEPVTLYAAGSLREALTAIAAAHEAATGQPVALTFGASGLLRERIEQGEPAQVFASADTENPRKLADGGKWRAPVVFTHNRLCGLAAAGVVLTPENFLDVLMHPAVRVGTSTPGADPSGDYVWELFRKAEALQPGALAALSKKALKLTGAADSPKPPSGRYTYSWIMQTQQADVFLTYCTNAVAARRDVPALQVVALPDALRVDAAYALTLRQGASPAAEALVRTLQGAEAQAFLQGLGFAVP